MSDLKFSHKGNAKLGSNVSTLSRETLASCFSSCGFYNNGCYAERVEKIYPNTKQAYRSNMQIMKAPDAWQKIRAFLLEAKKRGNAVRLNVNGDMATTDAIGRKIVDIKYLNNLKKAIKSIGIANLPKIWMYSHIPRKEVADLANYGVKVYGSVDNYKMLDKFKAAGFTHFAFSTDMRKGRDKVKSIKLDILDKPVPVCPEQIGTKKSCDTCNICINQTSHIAFLKH